VDGVDLAEFGAHFPDFQEESRGKRRESDVTLLDIHAGFAEGDKGIGARIGVDNGLQTNFGFVEFEGADGETVLRPAVPMKSPIRLMSGLSSLALEVAPP